MFFKSLPVNPQVNIQSNKVIPTMNIYLSTEKNYSRFRGINIWMKQGKNKKQKTLPELFICRMEEWYKIINLNYEFEVNKCHWNYIDIIESDKSMIVMGLYASCNYTKSHIYVWYICIFDKFIIEW